MPANKNQNNYLILPKFHVEITKAKYSAQLKSELIILRGILVCLKKKKIITPLQYPVWVNSGGRATNICPVSICPEPLFPFNTMKNIARQKWPSLGIATGHSFCSSNKPNRPSIADKIARVIYKWKKQENVGKLEEYTGDTPAKNI